VEATELGGDLRITLDFDAIFARVMRMDDSHERPLGEES
jgi:hypothetical protein